VADDAVKKIEFALGTGAYRFEVICDYDSDPAIVLPTILKLYEHKNEKRTLIEEIEMRELSLASKPLDVSVFDAARFFIRRNDTAFYYTNGDYYYKSFGVNGIMKSSSVNNYPAGVPPPRRFTQATGGLLDGKAIYLLFAGAIIFLPIGWLIRGKAKQMSCRFSG
jgi:hypothetical protein